MRAAPLERWPPRTAPASSAPRSRSARRTARWPWGWARARWRKRAETHPHFIAAVTHAVGGLLIPVPGGVLIRDGAGTLARRGRHLRRHLRQRRDRGDRRHRGRGPEGRSRSLSTDSHARAARSRNRAPRPRAGVAGAASRASSSAGPTCAFPLPERFAERLEGRTVERSTRRAKYLLVHLDERRGAGHASRHDRPLHRRRAHRRRERASVQLGEFTPRARRATPSTTMSCSRISSGAVVTYNDARRFGFMTLIADSRARRAPAVRAASASSRSATSSTPAYLAAARARQQGATSRPS